MSFNEAALEEAIIEMLGEQGYPHVLGEEIERSPQEVLIKEDLQNFLSARYAKDGITGGEIEKIIKQLEAFSAADLYESNKQIMKMVSDGFLLKREDRSQKDLYVELIDYSGLTEFREPVEGEVLTVGESGGSYGSGAGKNIFQDGQPVGDHRAGAADSGRDPLRQRVALGGVRVQELDPGGGDDSRCLRPAYGALPAGYSGVVQVQFVLRDQRRGEQQGGLVLRSL
jgi:hypothetical protein